MIYAIFACLLCFVLIYFAAFEYTRYTFARRWAKGLGGKAVFRIGRSHMERTRGGVQERVWINPDDKMAWGSILTAFTPSLATLFLEKETLIDFCFHVEAKTGTLFRTLSFKAFKTVDFGVRDADESLRLTTDDRAKAVPYFSLPQRRQAMMDLFASGCTFLRGRPGSIVAGAKGTSKEDTTTEAIGRYLDYLKNL